MEKAHKLAEGSNLVMATRFITVDLESPTSIETACQWWLNLTADGGEGMVVKPLDFLVPKGHSMLQPAVKCRGREYLRIIYGPEYDRPENISRLRKRSLGGKRALALREFALGLEALERLVEGEPLYRLHECVFAILALESQPIDPRL